MLAEGSEPALTRAISVPAETLLSFTTLGSNRRATVPRAKDTSEFILSVTHRLSPTFSISSPVFNDIWAVRAGPLTGLTVVSICFGKLASTAFAPVLRFVLMAATSAADWLDTNDFGAGTKADNSSSVAGAAGIWTAATVC